MDNQTLTQVETMIVSDVHLGSEISRASDLLAVLQSYTFRRLILLGDIFSDLNFKRLTKDHWKLLSHIRKLSNPKRSVETVWVEGNHDRGLSNVMSHLVGMRVFQEYGWESAGKKYLAIHGHQFDRFLVDDLLISDLMSSVYKWIQRCDLGQQRFSRCIDRLSTSWLRMTPRVAEGAIRFATEKGANYVFCGHTHAALHTESDGVHYYNAGGWTQSPATYITINQGHVRIHELD
ncbi:MAG: UDP-2,3-diacylglucosamine diphosphatase [Pyrinomonadaceae bacterium]|nr:UDP-2,3-diacylglucosamine diphosphatase [Pyrinomonadaceae bacterium]